MSDQMSQHYHLFMFLLWLYESTLRVFTLNDTTVFLSNMIQTQLWVVTEEKPTVIIKVQYPTVQVNVWVAVAQTE